MLQCGWGPNIKDQTEFILLHEKIIDVPTDAEAAIRLCEQKAEEGRAANECDHAKAIEYIEEHGGPRLLELDGACRRCGEPYSLPEPADIPEAHSEPEGSTKIARAKHLAMEDKALLWNVSELARRVGCHRTNLAGSRPFMTWLKDQRRAFTPPKKTHSSRTFMQARFVRKGTTMKDKQPPRDT
jgi:hypothetical protein